MTSKLVPQKSNNLFGTEQWNKLMKEVSRPYEWHSEYEILCDLMHKYVKLNDRLLRLACGDSKLGENLYDVGYRNIISVDSSEKVIKKMRKRNDSGKRDMEYTRMDVTDLKYDDESFNVVFDKQWLDYTFTNTSEDILKKVDKTFAEIQRVLKVGGRFIVCTLAQDHILDKLLAHFSQGWLVRVHKLRHEKASTLRAVFAFVFTKTKSSGQQSPFKVLELCIDDSDTIQRVQAIDEMKEAIVVKQRYALIRDMIALKFHPGENFTFDLWSTDPQMKEPRFSLTVVDSEQHRNQNGIFAIFIVPQGRETEWLFSSDDGLAQISSDAGYQRLVVVSLNRGHKYTSMDHIKEELSSKVMDLAPEGLTDKTKVPFLSVGGDIGIRKTVHEGSSSLSGDYIVEDITIGEDTFRRLVFLINPHGIQSEAKLFTAKDGKKKAGHIDFSFLAHSHHKAMVAGLALVDKLLEKEKKKQALIVGLGGGGLAMFIYQFFSQVAIDAVELDEAVVSVAKTQFGCIEDKRLAIHVKDGLKFIEEAHIKVPRPQYHAIMFDIDSKDVTVGMSAPSKDFVTPALLTRVKELLHNEGVFVLNLACRDKQLKASVIEDIKASFPRVYLVDIDDDVNDVLFAKPQPPAEPKQDLLVVRSSVDNLQKHGKSTGLWNGECDLCEMVEGLQIA
ncbi:predicted protein [Nematostella vectensis]|uniref:Methyltransferase domain-containing protein n=1 Tax=Nematostella vectensis TaxID=45351 RepID=A7RJC9_NEMVE|nr:predicted protein [Nematostella vectensis]|eukprot:XP_001640305.1 predicted protein [Nematostella vectensis]